MFVIDVVFSKRGRLRDAVIWSGVEARKIDVVIISERGRLKRPVTRADVWARDIDVVDNLGSVVDSGVLIMCSCLR